MAATCQQTSTIDFPAFLTEQHEPAWAEFQQHYRQCPACMAEVAQWRQLEKVLRVMNNPKATAHPSVEQLAQFQRRAERLTVEERRAIEQHLQHCVSCAEELSFVTSFNFSLLEEAKPAAQAAVEVPMRTAVQTHQKSMGTRVASAFAHFVDSLRSLLLQPAFAYGIALLLCIPTVRYFQILSTIESGESTRSMHITPEHSGGGSPTSPASSPATGISVSGRPEGIARTLLEKYKAAYEARDIQALSRIWDMNSDQRDRLVQLFEEARALSLLIDVREVQVSEDGTEVLVEFAQVDTLLKGKDRFSARQPVSYLAAIRKRPDSDQWAIQDLQTAPE